MPKKRRWNKPRIVVFQEPLRSISAEEIILCFTHQFPARYKAYNSLLRDNLDFTSPSKIEEHVLLYERFVKDMEILLDLIKGEKK